MDILTGLQNFLKLINDNWGVIVAIIALVFAIYKKIVNFISKSDEEKIQIAKEQISAYILKLISDAEVSYQEWTKAGSIKRSQVIAQIFADYPILSQITDQESLIAWIDEQIDNALKELREIVKENGGVPNSATITIPVNTTTVNRDCADSVDLF